MCLLTNITGDESIAKKEISIRVDQLCISCLLDGLTFNEVIVQRGRKKEEKNEKVQQRFSTGD